MPRTIWINESHKLVVFAPHLDDEVIGCYSALPAVDEVVFFTADYRKSLPRMPRILYTDNSDFSENLDCFLYPDRYRVLVPSRYDYHPLHKKVRLWAEQRLPASSLLYYSVEMNVPWLEEEDDPEAKRACLEQWYPQEYQSISKSDKYFLFNSIQTFDELIWAKVRFQFEAYHCWPNAPLEVDFLRNLHRHLFHFEVSVQQFGDDRDIEYFLFSRQVQQYVRNENWPQRTSCEMFAISVKRWVEWTYAGRLVRVSVSEDGENGCLVE